MQPSTSATPRKKRMLETPDSELEALETLEPSDEEADGDEEDQDMAALVGVGGDLSIPNLEETEWLDEKSDIVFTSGPVSEYCNNCELVHYNVFLSIQKYEVAYGERRSQQSSFQSKWPQIYVTKFYKAKDSSEMKSISLGIDVIHACSVALGILKAMENGPAREHFVNWIGHDIIKEAFASWRTIEEAPPNPVSEALQKAQKEEQKTKEKALAAKKKVELLKKSLAKYKRTGKH